MGDMDSYSIATYLGDKLWHLIPIADAVSATVCEDGVLDGSKPGVEILRPIPDMASYDLGVIHLLQVALGTEVCEVCHTVAAARLDLASDEMIWEMVDHDHGC